MISIFSKKLAVQLTKISYIECVKDTILGVGKNQFRTYALTEVQQYADYK